MKLIHVVQEIAVVWNRRNLLEKNFWQKEQRIKGAKYTGKLFAHLVKRKTEATEWDVVDLLFDSDATKYSHAHKTITRLWNTLKDSLLTLNVDAKLDRLESRVAFEADRDSFIARTLLYLGARTSAQYVAERAIRNAATYELYEQMFSLNKTLMHIHNATGNVIELLRVKEEIHRLSTIMFAEMDAELFSAEYNSKFKTLISKQSAQVIEAATEALQRIKELREEYGTYRIHTAYYMLATNLYMAMEDFEQSNMICAEALDYYRKTPHASSPLIVLNFITIQLANYKYLHQYKEGGELIEQTRKLYDKSIYTSTSFLHFAMLFRMAEGNYPAAQYYCEALLSNPQFTSMHRMLIADTYSVALFLQFLLDETTISKSPIIAVTLKKYDSYMRMYDNDKKGFNATVRMIKLLHALKNEDFTEVAVIMENLMKYHSRYLATRENLRSSLFIRLVNELVVHNLDTAKIRTQELVKYMVKLRNSASNPEFWNDPSEIMPLEKLWDIVLHLIIKHQQGLLQSMRNANPELGIEHVFSEEQLVYKAEFAMDTKRGRGRPRKDNTLEKMREIEAMLQRQKTGS